MLNDSTNITRMAGKYYTLEEAPESMQQWIREYKILQYYMLFDGQES